MVPFLLHCTNCDHEWQSMEEVEACDWCGEPGEKIADQHWSPTQNCYSLYEAMLLCLPKKQRAKLEKLMEAEKKKDARL